jgi:IS605 OrfB family transposase
MFVSLQFKLELRKEDKEKLIQLMRKQSSAIRVAYNMLKELEKEETKNPHVQIYQRLRKLFPELPTKYIDSAMGKAKQYPADKPVVFGGKRLFEKLCKNHLSGKLRERLKKQWKEQRQGTLVSIGSKSDKGNRLAKFEDLNGQLNLRITTGNREFMDAKVLREPSNNKDKWLTFMAMLLESWQTQNYFAYTVELKLREGEIYGSVSFEIPTPEVKYTKENGVIAIDTNASPVHLAIAEVSKTGELLSYQTISLHHLLGLSQNSKDHKEWILVHQLLDLAIQKGKAIAIENLKKLKKGVRGDGKAELRKRLHQWNAKKFLQKLKRVAMLKGVEVMEVNPAYTSVIGMLKYAPQLNIDKDIAGAYVIGRRALGFKEDTLKNMELSLKIALPGGRVERIKADFPYEGSPVGFRVLVDGKTGLVVGLSDDGQVKEVVFPDKVPLTSEKNLSALKDTAMLYGLIPWLLLWELLPSEWNWKKERFLRVSLSSFVGLS